MTPLATACLPRWTVGAKVAISTQPITWWQSIREKSGLHFSLLLQPEFTHLEVLSTESSVDDLGTCRGVVLRRAVTILRSIETQPLTGRFVRYAGQSSILYFYWILISDVRHIPIGSWTCLFFFHHHSHSIVCLTTEIDLFQWLSLVIVHSMCHTYIHTYIESIAPIHSQQFGANFFWFVSN